MAAHKLENHLRTYRKRAGLSQNEMAYLFSVGTVPWKRIVAGKRVD
jgi:hypothetical protein